MDNLHLVLLIFPNNQFCHLWDTWYTYGFIIPTLIRRVLQNFWHFRLIKWGGQGCLGLGSPHFPNPSQGLEPLVPSPLPHHFGGYGVVCPLNSNVHRSLCLLQCEMNTWSRASCNRDTESNWNPPGLQYLCWPGDSTAPSPPLCSHDDWQCAELCPHICLACPQMPCWSSSPGELLPPPSCQMYRHSGEGSCHPVRKGHHFHNSNPLRSPKVMAKGLTFWSAYR